MSLVGDVLGGYASVGAGLFKDSSLMGTFPLPPPNATSTPINMMCSVTNGSLGSYNPWAVPRPLEIKFYATRIPLSSIQLDPLSSSFGECLATSK